jgi:inward rectifier potassium channel
MKIRTPFKRPARAGENDLGFGTKITGSGERLLNKDGSFNVERRGLRSFSPYQSMVEMPWPRFFLWVLVSFVASNVLFALLFVLTGVEHLNGVKPAGFWHNLSQAFFFSVQTFTTVGYGAISPSGLPGNIIAALCALAGLLAFALVTGLFFAKFAKPKAQILFSRKAIIAPFRDGWAFMFRIANKRNNHIINLRAQVILSWVEEAGNVKSRRYLALSLDREEVTMFPLNWTLVHPITDQSPLHGWTPEDCARLNAEFIIIIQGHDETYNQSVHMNSSYSFQEIVWYVRYLPMYFSDGDKTILELDKIDDVEPVV